MKWYQAPPRIWLPWYFIGIVWANVVFFVLSRVI